MADASRDQLRLFIAQVGIVGVGIRLRRHVIALERMVNGIDPVPDDVACRLEDYTGPARFNYRLLAERAVRMLAQSQKANGKLREENARMKAKIATQEPQEGQ